MKNFFKEIIMWAIIPICITAILTNIKVGTVVDEKVVGETTYRTVEEITLMDKIIENIDKVF